MGFESYTLELTDDVYVLKMVFKRWGIWTETTVHNCRSFDEVARLLKPYVDVPVAFSDEEYEFVESEVTARVESQPEPQPEETSPASTVPTRRGRNRRNRRKPRK